MDVRGDAERRLDGLFDHFDSKWQGAIFICLLFRHMRWI